MGHVREATVAAPQRETAQSDAVAAPEVPLYQGDQLTSASVLMLQRSMGNTAVVRLLREVDDEGSAHAGAPEGPAAPGAEGEGEEVTLAPITIAAAEPKEVEVFAKGPMLEGKTSAAYTSTDPVVSPNPPKASKTTGCPDCGQANCIRAQGTVSSTFSSNPTVALPDLDGRGFTDCQMKNAEKFVKNVLDPHEQLHVKAFKSNFDGAWKKPFDLKVCDAADATTKIKEIYDTEMAARQKKADDASAELDTGGKNVFSWDMDEGCDKDKP